MGTLWRDSLSTLIDLVAARFSLVPKVRDRIVARSGGTPEGVLAYTNAVVDELVVPCCGS